MRRQPTYERRRRRWVRWLLGVVVAGVLVVGGLLGTVIVMALTAGTDTVGEVDFERPLAIPPLAESRVDADGRRVFDLTLQRGETDLGRGEATPTWGVNGSYLGPTLRAERGEDVEVNVTNDLDETSTLHWHGMHLPARMDGGPHQQVAAGDTWSPHWRIDQPASTLWYHPHPHGATADHVYRGIAGMFLIDDPRAEALPLPQEYGVDDVPVIVQDKRFDGHELDFSTGFFNMTNGILGDHVLVNGTPGPYLDVTTERVRLRLLNASNLRGYNFRLYNEHSDDDRRFDVIGTDGGLLPKPVRLDHLELAPGERAEIVVTMRPGEDTVLRSGPLDSYVQSRTSGSEDRLDIMQLRAADTLSPSPELPTRMAPAPRLSELADDEIAETREFRLAETKINGNRMDMDRIDLTAEVDTTERWFVSREAGTPHTFHIHDVQFQIASIDGEPPPPELAGWKDTVRIPEGGEVELLVPFTDYADPDVPYMYHCHVLSHEDQGMMGQFVVVEPGEHAGEVDHSAHHRSGHR